MPCYVEKILGCLVLWLFWMLSLVWPCPLSLLGFLFLIFLFEFSRYPKLFSPCVSILARARNFIIIIIFSLPSFGSPFALSSSFSFHFVRFTFIRNIYWTAVYLPGIVLFWCAFSRHSLSVVKFLAYVCCACRTQYDVMALRCPIYLRVLHHARY